MRQFFSFPNPVNETSARLVAVGVIAQASAFLLLRDGWLLVPLVYGFAARVATGPTMSPLGQLVTRVGTPAVERVYGVRSRNVPGPPKRFAQTIGLAFTGGAAIAWGLGLVWVSIVLLVGLLVAAGLEAVFAICLGCIAHAAIWGCDDCDDIADRLQQAIVRARESADAPDVNPQVVGRDPVAVTN